VLRCAEQIEAHDRESECRAGVRAELVATLASLQLSAEREEALALEAFSVLPRELTRLIFGWLPADARLRCREVCKPWWAFLEERRLWWSLDLSLASGVQRRSEALLRAASRRAGGQLRELDVSGWVGLNFDTLLSVAQENGASLKEIRAWSGVRFGDYDGEDVPFDTYDATICTRSEVLQLVQAVPQLNIVECDIYVDPREAAWLLSGEAPFTAVHAELVVLCGDEDDDDVAGFDASALFTALSSHETLKRLSLRILDLDARVLDAFIELALVRKLTSLEFNECRFFASALPAFARLLRDGNLSELSLFVECAFSSGHLRGVLWSPLFFSSLFPQA
jgi:hypothetical protein